MKKLIAVCISLIFIVGLCSCGTQKASSDNKKTADEVQNSSNASDVSTSESQETPKEVKIVVSPPEGWNPVVGSVLPVQYMKNTASFMVKEEKFSSKTVNDVVKEAKTYFENAFGNVKYIGEPEDIIVGGLEAQKIVFTCKVSSMQMKYEYVYLFAGGKAYAITFGDLENTFDSLSSDYEQILNNISFE